MVVDPARVVRELAGRGLQRLLTEGGPRMLGQFVAAGVLDELCLTLSPLLTSGDAQRIVGGPAVEVPERFALASLLEEDGFLFARLPSGPIGAEPLVPFSCRSGTLNCAGPRMGRARTGQDGFGGRGAWCSPAY